METGINFLPEIAEKEIKKGVYRRKVNVAAIASLLIVGVIIVGLIVYQLFLTSKATDLKNRSDSAETEVRKYSDVEIKDIALKEKLDKIGNFLNNALPGSSAIGQISSAGTSIVFKSITVADTGKVQVTGDAGSSDQLAVWITNLKNESGKDFFDNILLTSLNGQPGNYQFTMSFDFLKKGVRTNAK